MIFKNRLFFESNEIWVLTQFHSGATDRPTDRPSVISATPKNQNHWSIFLKKGPFLGQNPTWKEKRGGKNKRGEKGGPTTGQKS